MTEHYLPTHITLLQEQWAEYGVGLLIVLLRFFVRIRVVGLSGLKGDDYMTLIVLGMFTLDAVLVHQIGHSGTNMDVYGNLPVEEQEPYVLGSKLLLLSWYSYTAVLWGLKGCMLFFYKRLTFGLWQAKLMKWLAFACILTYIAVVLTITFSCWPFARNWKLYPVSDDRCGIKVQNFIVTCILNVLTDLALLFIPLPLIWKVKVTFKRKFALGILFSSGLFVITASIIRTTLSLVGTPSTSTIVKWGVRETFMGLVTANVPILKPILNKVFWKGASSLGLHTHDHNIYNLNDVSTTFTSGTRKPWRSEALHRGDGFVTDDEVYRAGSHGKQQVMVTTTIDVQIDE